MSECSKCGKEISMPYNCNGCGRDFCSTHRLPEKHNCSGLHQTIEITQKNNSRYQKIKQRLDTGDILDRLVYRSATISIGILMIVFYLFQLVSLLVFGTDVHNNIFVLSSENIEYIWTWFSSIFAHSYSSPIHLIGNLIILVFFGTLLEKTIGRKKYLALFISSGVIAALSQIMVHTLVNGGDIRILGASGALLSVIGAITVYNPHMKVYLYFLIPIPIWVISAGYVILSVFGFALAGGGVFGSVAHIAHLSGLLIGVSYGLRTKSKYSPKIKRLKFRDLI